MDDDLTNFIQGYDDFIQQRPYLQGETTMTTNYAAIAEGLQTDENFLRLQIKAGSHKEARNMLKPYGFVSEVDRISYGLYEVDMFSDRAGFERLMRDDTDDDVLVVEWDESSHSADLFSQCAAA